MTLTVRDPELDRPIEDLSQLVDYFRAGEKTSADFRVGMEHEKFPIYSETLAPVPYLGDRGIAALFDVLRREHGFGATLEGESVVGLERDGAAITLEPGGQLELSGAPLRTVHETCREFHDHLSLVKQLGEPLGIVWVGLGMHPTAEVSEIPRMPRERHRMMRAFFTRHGGPLALHMMHATCGVQASYDFSDERDAGRKLRVANAASPVLTALFANSAFSVGKPNGFESRRAQVWRQTDPPRCGFIPSVFEPDFLERGSYRAYTEWALDVPAMFLSQGQQYRMVGARSFRQLFESGEKLSLADWNLHLTTVFPEVRLKRVIEIRGADAVAPGLVCAMPAFWKGVFYDPQTLTAFESRLAHWRHADVDAVHAEVAKVGLSARTPDGPAHQVALELLQLSAAGLERLGNLSSSGQSEAWLLNPLFELASSGKSSARRLLDLWDGELKKSIDRLVAYSSY